MDFSVLLSILIFFKFFGFEKIEIEVVGWWIYLFMLSVYLCWVFGDLVVSKIDIVVVLLEFSKILSDDVDW